jgi:hypothetical protein
MGAKVVFLRVRYFAFSATLFDNPFSILGNLVKIMKTICYVSIEMQKSMTNPNE